MRAVILKTNVFAVYKSFSLYPLFTFVPCPSSVSDHLEIFQPMKAFLTIKLYCDQVEKAKILLFKGRMERN